MTLKTHRITSGGAMLRNATACVSLLAGLLLWGLTSAQAQVTNYTFSAVAGTYTEITGGTVHATGTGIGNTEYALALPFNFPFHGLTYASGGNIGVNANGFVTLGTGYGGQTAPLTSLSVPTIAGWANYLTGTATGELRSQTTGTSPNQVLTIQWKNFTRGPGANISNDLFNFQIKMYESGRIDIVYGAMSVATEVGAQIGISQVGSRLAVTARATLSPFDRPTISTATSNIESIASPNWVPSMAQTYSFIRRVAPTTNNDAGVYALANPSGKFNANTSQQIQVTIKNWGTNNLDSMTVNWSIDGAVKVPVKYYPQPALAPFAEATITIGVASFPTNSFSALRVWTTNVNGATDANSGNDAMVRWIAPRVSGTFNIAQGSGNPNTFPDFWSAMRHLRVSGISGDVTLQAFDGQFDGQVFLPAIDNALAGGRVSVVARAGETPVIQFMPVGFPSASYGRYERAHAAIVIEGGGAPYTINGLTVRLPNGTNAGGFVYGTTNFQTGTAITNLRLINSTFIGPDNWATMTQAADGIYLQNIGGANNEINRNTLTSFPYGIFWDNELGASTKVLNNTVNNAHYGAYVFGASAMEISGNTVSGSAVFTDYMGIYGYSAGTSTITNNRISTDLTLAGSNAVGIAVLPRIGSTFTVTNNMVAIGSATSGQGINVQALNGGLTRLYHNTVNFTGTGGTGNITLYINSSLGTAPNGLVHAVNNIFSNVGTGSNGGYTIRQDDASVVLNNTTLNSLVVCDFNDLYTTGTVVGAYDGFGYLKAAAPLHPLTNWRNATARDYNSAAIPAVFVGGSDLHLLNIQQGLWGTNTVISFAPNDIDGDPRVKPYMGADEVLPKIVIIQQPESRYACVGDNFNLIAIADVTPGATVTYQWQKDGVNLVGRTSAILPFTGVGYGSSGVYTAIVTATDGSTTVTVATLPATVIVVRPTEITEQPASKPVGLGQTVNLTAQAEAVGSPTDFVASYQWKKRFWNPLASAYQDSNVTDDGRITGAQSNILTIRNVRASDTADSYVMMVTGYCGNATSKAARLFIPQVVASNNTPDGCAGSDLQFEVAAFPSSVAGTTLTYQWFKNGARLTDDNRTSGSMAKTLGIADATAADAGTYFVEVTYGNGDATIQSNTLTVTIGTPAAITTAPAGDIICAGEAAQLSVTATGGNLSYRWYKGTSAIPGANGPTYDIASATINDAGTYHVVVSNGCGEVESANADLVVNVKPTITTEPNDQTVDVDRNLTLTVAAGGTSPVTYQWFKNDAAITGETGENLTVSTVSDDDAGTYFVVATNGCGSDTSRSVIVIITGVTDNIVEAGYMLGVASPNPTNDVVTFDYTLPSTQHVRITLTDVMGRVLALIVDGTIDAGSRHASFSTQGLNLTAGVYNYTINAGNFVASQQVVVVK